MEKVLIFTNWESYSTSLTYYCNFDRASYPNSDNPLKKYCCDDTKFYLKDVKDCADAGVYLVFDKINKKEFSPLLEPQNHPSFFLLHQRGDYHLADIPAIENCLVREGSHIDSIYREIFSILGDPQNNKTERIIRVFWPKLETVVRFLNECLTPKSELFKEYEKKILGDFNGICFSVDSVEYPVNDSVKEFCVKYSNANELGAYESDLINLRDILINAATK